MPVEEEVKVKPAVLLRHSREDYYGSLSEDCRVRHDINTHMDSLKVSLGPNKSPASIRTPDLK